MYLDYLIPKLGEVAKRTDARHTKYTDDLIDLGEEAEKKIRAGVVPLFGRMSKQIRKSGAKAFEKLTRITPNDARVTEHVTTVQRANVDLVVNAGRVYAKQVEEIFTNPANIGRRVEDLKAELLERGNVSEARAELIARDQTLKLNAGITKIRHENAGIREYIWSTSRDERVREEHAELEGERFSYDAPPEPGNPGEDYQCRCVALPVIEEFEGIF